MSQGNPTPFQINTYAENYVLYGDQSRAWRVTFPDSKAKAECIHVKAAQLHSLVKVKLRIKKIQSTLQKQSEEEFSITASDLKQMLVIAAQGGLKIKTDPQNNEVLTNIGGAVSAIAEINKMDGNHAATKQEVTNLSELTPWDEIDVGVDD